MFVVSVEVFEKDLFASILYLLNGDPVSSHAGARIAET